MERGTASDSAPELDSFTEGTEQPTAVLWCKAVLQRVPRKAAHSYFCYLTAFNLSLKKLSCTIVPVLKEHVLCECHLLFDQCRLLQCVGSVGWGGLRHLLG